MDSVIALVSCCGVAGVSFNFSNSLVRSSNLRSALGYSGVGLLGEIVVVKVVAGRFANGVPTSASSGRPLVGVFGLGGTAGEAASAADSDGALGSPADADAAAADGAVAVGGSMLI